MNRMLWSSRRPPLRLAGSDTNFTGVYDGVIGPWFVSTFLKSTGLVSLHYAMLVPPLSVCLDRVRSREGHGFTDLGTAEHMWNDFHRPNTHGRYDVDLQPAPRFASPRRSVVGERLVQ